MAFELRQNLKLSQQLIMTPQLQQAIKLLILSRQELVDTINQEMEENPLLEEAAPDEAARTRRTGTLSPTIFPESCDVLISSCK